MHLAGGGRGGRDGRRKMREDGGRRGREREDEVRCKGKVMEGRR